MPPPPSAPPLRIAVLIPAAGSGTRMGSGAAGRHNKVLLPLAREPLLRHTVRAFQGVEGVGSIRVVAHPEDLPELERAFHDRALWPRLGPWIAGGAERQDSVRLGLEALAAAPDGPPGRVLVHDGARPLCSPGMIAAVLEALGTESAVVPVLPVWDTVRMAAPLAGSAAAGQGTAAPAQGAAAPAQGAPASPPGSTAPALGPTAPASGSAAPALGSAALVPGLDTGPARSQGVLERRGLRLSQTPQGFHWDVLWEAHRRAQRDGFIGTDDGQLVERLGLSVALVRGERRNLKITLPEDLALAEWIWAHPAWGTRPA